MVVELKKNLWKQGYVGQKFRTERPERQAADKLDKIMIQEKELDKIPKCLDEMDLVPLEVWKSINDKVMDAGIVGFTRTEEDSIFYKVEIKRDAVSGFTLEGYSATLLRVGEINHERIHGIDTALIEDTMRKYDWRIVTPEMLREKPDALAIMNRLLELHSTDDLRGMEIAVLLTMKYFAGTPLGLVFDFSKVRKNYETTLFIELNGDSHDLNIKDAYQILSGRGVARSITPDGKSEALCWLAMENGKVAKVEDFNVAKCLSSLPFDQPRSVLQLAEDIAEMSAGNQGLGKFRIDDNTFHAYYEPDPRRGQIALRDLSQQKIDLDELRSNPELVKELPKKKFNKGKGLGL